MTNRDLFLTFAENSFKYGDIDPIMRMSKYLKERNEYNAEQMIYFCILMSITYNCPTAYELYNEYPDIENIDYPTMRSHWDQVQGKYPFQTDKLKQRKNLPETLRSVQELMNQKSLYESLKDADYDEIYTFAKQIYAFGRFSIWNFQQSLLEVCGIGTDPHSLYLGQSDSISITDGMCRVLNREEWMSKKVIIDGKKTKILHNFTKDEKDYLENELKAIHDELNGRGVEINLFQMESLLCAFKKLFRTNSQSRYCGYYIHRLAEDLQKCEQEPIMSGVDWRIFREGFSEIFPDCINFKVNKNLMSKTIEEKIKYNG